MKTFQALFCGCQGVKELTCGDTFTARGQGFSIGLVASIEGKDALGHFLQSEQYTSVRSKDLLPIMESEIHIDYECVVNHADESKASSVEHMVICKFKDMDSKTMDGIIQAVIDLKKVPGVQHVSAGQPFNSEGHSGYSLGLVVRLDNEKALDTYQKHEAHQRVLKEYLKPALQGPVPVIALDYVVEAS